MSEEAITPEVVTEAESMAVVTITPFTIEVHGHAVNMSPEAALSWQYNRCNRSAAAYVMECCKFGDMLYTVDAFLSKQRFCRKDQIVGNTLSLKEWLTQNCPEIKYDTAKSYQYAAVGVRRISELSAAKPLLPYLSRQKIENEAEDIVRRRILDVVNTSSLNFLRKAANPEISINALKGSVGVAAGRRALTAEEKSAEAKQTSAELVGKVAAFLRSGQFALLSEDDMRTFVIALKGYATEAEQAMPLH